MATKKASCECLEIVKPFRDALNVILSFPLIDLNSNAVWLTGIPKVNSFESKAILLNL